MSRNSIKGHNSTSLADTNSVDMEETISCNNTSKTQLQALPTGWIELPSHQCDTGQNIYIKTVVDKDYAKCLPKCAKLIVCPETFNFTHIPNHLWVRS